MFTYLHSRTKPNSKPLLTVKVGIYMYIQGKTSSGLGWRCDISCSVFMWATDSVHGTYVSLTEKQQLSQRGRRLWRTCVSVFALTAGSQIVTDGGFDTVIGLGALFTIRKFCKNVIFKQLSIWHETRGVYIYIFFKALSRSLCSTVNFQRF